jgi:hypothetical protein
MDCTLYNTLPEGFSSCTLSQEHPSRVSHMGTRRGCAAGQQHPALWGFYTPTLDFLGSLPLAACQWSSLKHPVPAPCHCRGYPQQVVPRVAQSILGPARRLGGRWGSGLGQRSFWVRALGPGPSSACTRVLCMNKSVVHAQESCACTRILDLFM